MRKNWRHMSTLTVLGGIVLALAGIAGAFAVAPASAKQFVVQTISMSPRSTQDCGVCQYAPAVATSTTHKSSSSSSSLHITVIKGLKPQVRQYEKVMHVRVTIDKMPGGVKSTKGCVDPVKKGWIKPGGTFSNTQGITVYRFDDAWKAGTLFCNFHPIHWRGQAWLEGRKGDCGNPNVRIPLFPYHVTRIIPVKRFVTVKSFRSVYNKWVTKSAKTSSTSTTSVSYSCTTYGDDWKLGVDGNGKQICSHCPPPCPTPTTPATTTTKTVTVPTTVTTTTSTTTTSTPQHFTNLTCQGQEEVTGGASSLLVCQVSNDNGAQIALSVKVVSNPANLLVSGIQCSSQGGTPSCQGNGTFEIRLGGVNDTSSPVYSELNVTATSNGVPSAPFDQTFKVDPSSSNFNSRMK